LGYRADVVGNGVEVLQALERQSYDVVLMDVQMPEMDGLEATRRLRQRFGAGAPRVIAMTANAMPGDREKCLEAGMVAYVSKPLELADIRNVLQPVVRAAGAAPALIDARRIAQLRELEDENNPNLVADIIELFLADAPKHLCRIALALDRQDAAQLEANSHRLLSGIENLGALRMREPCVELERLGREGALGGAAAQLARLQREFELAQQTLRSTFLAR
jgi:CheY-like chemotaxis protein/HPt (histidine-containing phosphotransfer) domain-containing protein